MCGEVKIKFFFPWKLGSYHAGKAVTSGMRVRSCDDINHPRRHTFPRYYVNTLLYLFLFISCDVLKNMDVGVDSYWLMIGTDTGLALKVLTGMLRQQ